MDISRLSINTKKSTEKIKSLNAYRKVAIDFLCHFIVYNPVVFIVYNLNVQLLHYKQHNIVSLVSCLIRFNQGILGFRKSWGRGVHYMNSALKISYSKHSDNSNSNTGNNNTFWQNLFKKLIKWKISQSNFC